MTVTESKPEEATAIAESAPVEPALPPPPAGLAGIFGTADHKAVGRLYLAFSLLFAIGSLVLGGLIAIEGADASGLDVLASDTFFQVLTLSNISLVFMAVLPAFLGLGHLPRAPPGRRADDRLPPGRGRLLLGSGWSAPACWSPPTLMNGGPGGGDADGVLLSLHRLGDGHRRPRCSAPSAWSPPWPPCGPPA